MGIANDFADSPKTNLFGIMTGTASVLAFPSVPCLMVRLKVSPTSVTTMQIGTGSDAVWPLAAGDDTGWIACNNLNQFSYKGSSGTISYWAQG